MKTTHLVILRNMHISLGSWLKIYVPLAIFVVGIFVALYGILNPEHAPAWLGGHEGWFMCLSLLALFTFVSFHVLFGKNGFVVYGGFTDNCRLVYPTEAEQRQVNKFGMKFSPLPRVRAIEEN